MLDLFGGSGSTLIACERRGRSARLLEIDPRYCNVIVRRWENYTGQQRSWRTTAEPSGETARMLRTGIALRRKNLQLLESLSESDLDKPTSWQPGGLEEHFATRGKSLLTLSLHQMGHRGQITEAIRSAGRPAPIAVGVEA